MLHKKINNILSVDIFRTVFAAIVKLLMGNERLFCMRLFKLFGNSFMFLSLNFSKKRNKI